MSDFEKFKEQLRSKEKCYSSLTGRVNSDKEYDHILKVWNRFGMKTMKDYHDLFLKCNILLLGNVFENFRNSSLKNYGLCPSHKMRCSAMLELQCLVRQKLNLNLLQILTCTYS